MLPNVLLSGMIFPIASMPGWLQPVTNVVPARWFIVIARGIMLKGVGLDHLWRETLVLLAMMGFFMMVSVRSFKPRLG
jgi:ABC-2 type transport system permease protein